MSRRVRCLVLSVLSLGLLAACGSGSAGRPGGPGGSGGPAEPAAIPGSAKFHVDVATGQVTVDSLGGASRAEAGADGGRAVFLGGAVQFHTSALLDQPGNTGLRILDVSLTNGWVKDIGLRPGGQATGVRVLFSQFAAAPAFSDLRPKVTVSTVAGSGVAGTADGPADQATFRALVGAAVGLDGAVYLADGSGNRIRKFSGGFVSTVAGGATGGTDGLGAAATFTTPTGIAVNPVDGTLVVTELGGNRIRRVTPDGRVTRIAGTGVLGGADGAGNLATFGGPCGVAVATDGTIFVSEFAGHRIRRIRLTGADPTLAASYTVSLVAGSGVPGSTDAVGAAARFNRPAGIALWRPDRLVVADQSNRRLRLVSTDGAVSTIAGTGVASSADGSGEVASFNAPNGVAVAGDALLVTEVTGKVVRQVRLKAEGAASPASPTSWQVATLAGQPLVAVNADGDGTVATFVNPGLPALDAAGNVLIPDGLHLRRMTPVSGLFPLGNPDGSAAEGVRLSSADGTIPRSQFGLDLPFVLYPGSLAPGAATPARSWVFAIPAGVRAFEFMVTVEADTPILAPPEAITVVGGVPQGSPAVRVRTLLGPDVGYVDGPLSLAMCTNVLGLAVDDSGAIFFTESAGRVRRISPDGIVSTVAGLGSAASIGTNGNGNTVAFAELRGIVVSRDGRTLFVAEPGGHRIRRINNPFAGTDFTNPALWQVLTVAGNGTAGNLDGTGDVATVNDPRGVAQDAGGAVYFTEGRGNRVRRMVLTSSATGGASLTARNFTVKTLAGDATAINGAAGNVNASPSSVARFNSPDGIAVDLAGVVYVAEAGNADARVIHHPDGVTFVGALAGSTPGFADGLSSLAKFGAPRGLAVDVAGYTYVVESAPRFQSAVRRISPILDFGASPTSDVTTVAGGLADFTAPDGTGETARFKLPEAIAIDTTGNIYVGDQGAIRVIQRALTR